MIYSNIISYNPTVHYPLYTVPIYTHDKTIYPIKVVNSSSNKRLASYSWSSSFSSPGSSFRQLPYRNSYLSMYETKQGGQIPSFLPKYSLFRKIMKRNYSQACLPSVACSLLCLFCVHIIHKMWGGQKNYKGRDLNLTCAHTHI